MTGTTAVNTDDGPRGDGVPTTLAPLAYPAPPGDLGNATSQTLRETVRAYERAYRRNSLLDAQYLTYFSMGYTEPATVTVRNRTAERASVSISGRYSYGTPEYAADFVPFEGLYVVNGTSITRLD